jgi:Penicillin binding protein transpeptidase domain/Penicillin-binding Protein dimerisation domain/NTF2-like N-terminal transpeptidase domain
MFYRSAEVMHAMRFSGQRTTRFSGPLTAGSSGRGVRSSRRRARSPARNRRRRRQWRIRALVGVAVLAFLAGVIAGAAPSSSSSAHALAARFASAWARGDYAAMYPDIDRASRREVSASEFAAAYRQTALTATATRLRVAGSPRDVDGPAPAVGVTLVAVPVRVYTRLFGTLSASFTLPVRGAGARARVVWSRALLFPGLRAGEQLTRHTFLPPRAPLLARDGSVLASGAAVDGQRSSPLGELAGAVVGATGAIPSTEREALESQGVPSDALVGTSGLEQTFDASLRGTPGGELLAGQRVLASAAGQAGSAVRTSVSPAVQHAAVEALGGQYGGIVALDPATGAILAVAGIGIDDLQPPGSTFKMITLSATLQAGLAKPTTVFPYATYATLDGVKLSNANGEDCGGSLALAFAVSCNSVFAPLGVRVGAPRLVATAEGFGFNHPPGVAGAVESTLPPASRIQGELDVGSTAIGQGEVQASALEMATVAATIADGGRRPQPTFALTGGRPAPGPRAVSPAVARTVRRLMIGVVREGTGTAAAIPGVTVAGKTGTAELGGAKSCKSASESGAGSSTSESGSGESGAGECQSAASEAQNTDAWFAAFAPALHPRIVVGVLLVRDGAGGATAAPVARQVLEAGLKASR